MASAGNDASGGRSAHAAGERPEADRAGAALGKPDRRAEALRANLKRRKAQTRARGEARQDDRPDDHAAVDAPAGDA